MSWVLLNISWVLFVSLSPLDHSLLAYTQLLVNKRLSQAHYSNDLPLALLRFNSADRLYIKKIIN